MTPSNAPLRAFSHPHTHTPTLPNGLSHASSPGPQVSSSPHLQVSPSPRPLASPSPPPPAAYNPTTLECSQCASRTISVVASLNAVQAHPAAAVYLDDAAFIPCAESIYQFLHSAHCPLPPASSLQSPPVASPSPPAPTD